MEAVPTESVKKREKRIPPVKSQFKTGQANKNPTGRPKQSFLSSWFNDYQLDKHGKPIHHPGRPPLTRLELLMEECLKKALTGTGMASVKALELALAYGLGKPKETVELTGAGGGPLQIEDPISLILQRMMSARAAEIEAKQRNTIEAEVVEPTKDP